MSLFHIGVIFRGRAEKVEDTKACDVRNREVRSGHRSEEGGKQGREPAVILDRRPRPRGSQEFLSHSMRLDGYVCSTEIQRLRQKNAVMHGDAIQVRSQLC